MAKVIRYAYVAGEINYGTQQTPDIRPVIREKTVTWSQTNEAIARMEAYNGSYTVEEDGRPEPAPRVQAVLDALLGVCP